MAVAPFAAGKYELIQENGSAMLKTSEPVSCSETENVAPHGVPL